MAKSCIVVGNWKMYKTIEEAVNFVKAAIPLVAKSDVQVYLAVPFTALQASVKAAAGSNIVIGAQNMFDAREGAFTGEIAGRMLVDAGARFVILGHSERRQSFHEDDAFINRKVKAAFEEGLQPILCVGENASQRQEGKTEEVLRQQLADSLEGIKGKQASSLLVAYEPIWAIGTGNTATPDMAEAAHIFCRAEITDLLGKVAGSKVPLLYGGSVRPDNGAALLAQPDIDGLLVGGAALEPTSFAALTQFTGDNAEPALKPRRRVPKPKSE